MPLPLKIARKIHLFLGLTCGIIASISGLTGSLYVWQPEIVAALNPQLLKVDSFNHISEAKLLKTSRTLYKTHKDSVGKIFLPYREQQSISVIYRTGKTLYYHPGTGELLGEKSVSILFFENLLKIHRSLGISGIGKYIVGGSAILFFLFLLTSGFFLWWKKYKLNFKKGIKIKWRRNKKRFNYDVHKSLGFLFFTPLLIIAFSGAYFTFNIYYKKGLKLMDSFQNVSSDKKIREGDTLDIHKVLENPDKKYSLRAIYFPEASNAAYQFRYIEDRFIVPGLRKTRELKLNEKGKVLSFTSFYSDPLSEQIASQFYPLHIGEIAGLSGRILVFISGFIPVILFITGLRFYFWRSINKKHLKQ